MSKKYMVTLTEKGPARRLVHARILLKADRGSHGLGLSDGAIAEAVEVSRPTVERVRKRFVEEGLEAMHYHRCNVGLPLAWRSRV